MIEEWRPVPGTDGWYEVSNHGQIRSWKRKGANPDLRAIKRDFPVILRRLVGKDVYPRVRLVYADGVQRTAKVHNIVLETFVGPRPEGSCIRHLDGDKSNPRLDNLAYGTLVENAQDSLAHGVFPIGERAGSSKLTEAQVREIRALPSSLSDRKAAEIYGVGKSAIRNVRSGVTWRHVA